MPSFRDDTLRWNSAVHDIPPSREQHALVKRIITSIDAADSQQMNRNAETTARYTCKSPIMRRANYGTVGRGLPSFRVLGEEKSLKKRTPCLLRVDA